MSIRFLTGTIQYGIQYTQHKYLKPCLSIQYVPVRTYVPRVCRISVRYYGTCTIIPKCAVRTLKIGDNLNNRHTLLFEFIFFSIDSRRLPLQIVPSLIFCLDEKTVLFGACAF